MVTHAAGLFEICNFASDGEIYGIPNPSPRKINNIPIITTKTGIAF
jgi:hypothetical protein